MLLPGLVLNPRRQVYEDPDRDDVAGFDNFYRAVPGEETILFEAQGANSIARVHAGNSAVENNSRFLGTSWTSDGGTLPTTGAAEYEGFYAGVLTSLNGNFRNESYISGEVAIDVDFDAMQAHGVISNRKRYLTASGAAAGSQFDDVSLGIIDLEDGVASDFGITGGGRLVQTNAQPENTSGVLDGTWRAALAGDEAAEIVGNVFIRHDYVNTGDGISGDFQESGVFLADRQP